ncbi:MAG: hypothetical protein PHD81_04390 [Candidatus Nanoarchaeia archaeon]|nr:hypothetical protein [Candidatus Nanoarchaeia archaeon]
MKLSVFNYELNKDSYNLSFLLEYNAGELDSSKFVKLFKKRFKPLSPFAIKNEEHSIVGEGNNRILKDFFMYLTEHAAYLSIEKHSGESEICVELHSQPKKKVLKFLDDIVKDSSLNGLCTEAQKILTHLQCKINYNLIDTL